MLSFITEKLTAWEKLKAETRPIFIYGMGKNHAGFSGERDTVCRYFCKR